MKPKYWKPVLYALMLMSLAATLAILITLPDQIPVHYNLNGEIDRWGSKYENLILTALPLAAGTAALAVARQCRKKGAPGSRGEGIALMAGAGGVLLLGLLAVVLYLQAYRVAVIGSDGPADINRILFTALGLLLIPVGNLLPKLGRRTGGSGTPAGQWRINRTGGAVLMLMGAVIALGNAFFVPERASLWFSIGGLLAAAAVVALYACAVYTGFGEEK